MSAPYILSLCVARTFIIISVRNIRFEWVVKPRPDAEKVVPMDGMQDAWTALPTGAPPKMAQVIARGLRADIASGRLANGKRLPLEPELIAKYGVSRAVVREALRLLESAGLVVVKRGPKGGAVVTHRTSAVVRESLLLSLQLAEVRLGEVYDCLLGVLPAAARLAAEKRPAETAEALRQHSERHRRSVNDLHSFSLQNQAFNQVMLANCGNHAMQLFASSMLEIMREVTDPVTAIIRHKMSETQLREGLETMLKYQDYLATVIADGNGAHAGAVWRRYVERVGERFFRLIPRDLELISDASLRRGRDSVL
ncbi:FadR/GntR family transcriptional regulator [Sphingomonas tabacisoli]|uniref:FadR/GntR family transcriptional regulator n=1 Tax=Sphingomonas tabacisoli TaxID=2249466 RepID=A0ABW4I5Q0_9SPHN